MLNYIWLTLIILGVAVAVFTDVGDISSNPYRNGERLSMVLQLHENQDEMLIPGKEYSCLISMRLKDIWEFYAEMGTLDDPLAMETLPATIKMAKENQGRLTIQVDQSRVNRWKKMASLQGTEGRSLRGQIDVLSISGSSVTVAFMSDPIRFVALNKVTNDGIVKYAKVAVELAIGLVGIMAFWLGVMKIAEQAGLIARLAKLLKPITTRLFPDIPADHPAMGAMLMNISANMLGLANAATPLGLKAMEELNKLNKKIGTATDAMCTFLVINTSNVQLIPATVIAIRAASGSTNPTEIIGPVIVATAVSTIVGVFTVKVLARLPFYRKQLQTEG